MQLSKILKIGDKVKFIKPIGDCTEAFNLTLGKIYTIIGIVNKGNGCIIINDINSQWFIQDKAFFPFKKELKTEMDYLDHFKENFKDGI